VRDEFLTPLGPEKTAFLMRTSVLDTLSPAVCDAILECSGSGRTLAELASSNALLISLDRNGDSYRHHPLLAQMLRAELRRLEPLRECHLHRLASAWYGAQQEQRLAIRHAVAAGEVATAGDLLSAEAPALIAHGRNDTVQSWLNEFSAEQIAGCAPLALVAANSRLAAGAGADAEHWAAAAVRRMADAPRRTRDSLRAAALLPAAVAARDGLAGMRRDTARARELGPDDGPLISTCNLLEGVALHLTGDRDGARGFLAAGARGGAGSAPNVQALCLAQLGLILVQDENWESAASVTTRARSKLELAGLGSYPTSALVFAVSGLVRAHRGMRDEALVDTQRSSSLVGLLEDFAPWYQAETVLVLARAALRLGHLTNARTLTAEAERFVHETPDSPVLRDWIDESRARLGAITRSAEKACTLTAAELRVLRLLPTHLSFPAIAKSLYVSPNTVKTHVRAVYRKLDASSRAEAVALALDAGLLEAQRAA
jgi:LuxR family transcriptional regulator, maltose regulon positive regulatory protein